MENRFNLPNTLTVLRFILSPVFFYFLINKDIELALVTFMFVAVTDFADGWIARSTNQKTKFGEMLDPLADKFMVSLAIFALVIGFGFPYYIFPLIILRDIVSIVGGILLYKEALTLWKPKLPGKITTLFQVITIIGFIIDFEYKFVITWITVFLSIGTSLIYCFNGVKVLMKKSN